MKPKENKGYTPGKYDSCQTPPYALEPLLPYLDISKRILEPAAGKGTIIRTLKRNYFDVVKADILYDPDMDFFNLMWVDVNNAIQVTNPPYSVKYKWLEKSYHLNIPFALLMPVEMLGTAKGQKLFNKYGIEIIFISPRVDFYMPNKGYEGGGAQFPTAWFTWKLNLPKEINFATLNKPKRSELKEYWEKALGE